MMRLCLMFHLFCNCLIKRTMKATEITMQIVKNLGNYETCRLEATFTLDDKDDLTQSFVMARKELEQAYDVAYEKIGARKELTLTSPRFDNICKALHENKTDVNELQQYFILTTEVINYFIKNKLI